MTVDNPYGHLTQDLTFDDYARESRSFAVYPRIEISIDGGPLLDATWIYPMLGLAGEVGELMEKAKKLLRDHHGVMPDDAYRQGMLKEASDALWYLTRVPEAFQSSLAEVARINLDKLSARAARGALQGSGDER